MYVCKDSAKPKKYKIPKGVFMQKNQAFQCLFSTKQEVFLYGRTN